MASFWYYCWKHLSAVEFALATVVEALMEVAVASLSDLLTYLHKQGRFYSEVPFLMLPKNCLQRQSILVCD